MDEVHRDSGVEGLFYVDARCRVNLLEVEVKEVRRAVEVK